MDVQEFPKWISPADESAGSPCVVDDEDAEQAQREAWGEKTKGNAAKVEAKADAKPKGK